MAGTDGGTRDARPQAAFRRVVGWTVLGALLPGAGLVAAGRRRAGLAVLAIAVLGLGALAVTVVRLGPDGVLQYVVTPAHALTVAWAAAGIAALWALVVIASHLALRRGARLGTGRSVAAGALALGLGAAVVAPAAVAVDYGRAYGAMSSSVFAPSPAVAPAVGSPVGGAPGSAAGAAPGRSVAQAVTTPADPWAGRPRVNVLLIGSDAGKDRWGIRTDTLVVASIDTVTGDTVLVSLPRNLQRVPFRPGSPAARDYPDGFVCAQAACLLNALWTFGVEHRAQYFPQARNDFEAGYTATREGVEQVTGLAVDTYVMVDLRGFSRLIDAVGGVTVNVTQRLPIGGSHGANGQVLQRPSGYLEPGVRTLNGYEALWFARSRYDTSDYDRMARQRCLIGDVVDQVDPQTAFVAFPRLARVAKDNLRVGVSVDELAAWVGLAYKVKSAKVVSLALTNDVISTVHPDVPAIRQLVARTIRTTDDGRPSAGTTPAPSATPTTPKTPPPAGDLASVCPPSR